MFQGKTLNLNEIGEGFAELQFDRAGEPVNKFDHSTVGELKRSVDLLKSHPGLRGVLVTSAKDSFIVGADIFEFAELFSKDEAGVEEFNAQQSAIFTAFSELPVPTAVAINGMAFGGGFEMALACDWRSMADVAVVGLPEVTLGIIPAFGGSVRLPRVAGAGTALEWVTGGVPQKSAAALAAGAVDAVVSPEALRESTLTWLRAAASGVHDWQARRSVTRGPVKVDDSLVEKYRAATAKTARHYPAAAGFVEFLSDTAGLGALDALRHEARAFAKLASSPCAASLVRLFVNGQFLKKKAKGYVKEARPVRQAAVLGAGIMGGGIAYTSAVHGTPVLMKDIAQNALDLGMSEADKLLAKQVEAKRISADKAATIRRSIKPRLDFESIDQVDVVVEAIVENLTIKKKVLAEVESLLRDDSVIASNTSSLSIADMAEALKRPQNFVGMHFFNPVPQMPLVEVIRGPQTDPDAASTIASYAQAMGKTPIVVRDCPGFLVNRVLTPYSLAFLRLLRDGADFQQVDRVMEAFGWPMGPAYLDDVIGMDTLVHVLDVISHGYGSRMVPDFPTAVELMLEHKRLGQKSGAGFYRYETDAKGKPRKQVDLDVAALIATIQPEGSREFGEQEIVDRMMLPMVLEAARCLDEGVAESAIEVDMGLVLGIGFPRHLGGVLHWADQMGAAELVKRCDRYAAISRLYHPSDAMLERAAKHGRFHTN
jgi:3-hydroxyacyl-CoA dehydrogenase / enoyl-CoA hydratase / 3-hydroxybutyryl-CoA epimerase / enoyl-CoA isomerase